MKKLSAYQKLKIENEELKQDIRALITEPDSFKGVEARCKHEFKYALEDVVFFSNTYCKKMTATGFLNMMNTTNEFPESRNGITNQMMLVDQSNMTMTKMPDKTTKL